MSGGHFGFLVLPWDCECWTLDLVVDEPFVSLQNFFSVMTSNMSNLLISSNI